MIGDKIANISHDAQIKFICELINNLTVHARYHYDNSPEKGFADLKEINEQIHRVSGSAVTLIARPHSIETGILDPVIDAYKSLPTGPKMHLARRFGFAES